MATLPFRPPQFSEDLAWLPAWLQPNQSTSTSQAIANHELFQNVDSLKGENSQVKEPNFLTNTESKYDVCRLYLSVEESSPVTVTPSCEKVLHFNLHLSTDETSSIITNPLLHTSQDDKFNSAPALFGTREKNQSRIGHDCSKLNFVPSTSNDYYSQQFARQTSLRNDAGQNTSEILNSKCVECDDISNAVELSVAASEALVIHKIIQSESLSEASVSAVLEVALQVKQARFDELKDSPCCFKDFGNDAGILSDFGDSDMEDAYNDVGLSVSILDNSLLKDSSTSRVKETPISEIHVENKEVQCEWHGDQELYSNNCFTREEQDKNSETIKSKDPPAKSFDGEKMEKLCRKPPLDLTFVQKPQNRNIDALQTLQEEEIDLVFGHQQEVNPPIQLQHSKTTRLYSKSTIQHLHHVDINDVNDRSSCGFQSRWFGGWPGMKGDACDGMKSRGRKTVPNFYPCETSYLSESMDVFPDQNSVVHTCHISSNASEAEKPVENLYETAAKEAFLSQEVVKDSLCSMVPCSISAEISDAVMLTNNKDAHQVLDAFKSLPTDTEISVKIAKTNSGRHDENMGGEKHGDLVFNDVDPSRLIHEQLTSLKTNSVFNCGSVNLVENDSRLLSESTRSPNDKVKAKKPLFRSMSNCATYKSNQEVQEMKQLSMERRLSCTKTLEKNISTTNYKEHHVDFACVRLTQDHLEKNADKGVEQQVDVENIPTSSLVLSHKRRRLKAPKFVSDVPTANLLENQALASNVISHKISRSAQDQFRNLPNANILSRKRVHFSDADFELQLRQGQLKKNLNKVSTCENRSSCRLGDRLQNCEQVQGIASQEVKECLTKCRIKGRKRNIFQGLDFLLTGFSKKKEKDLEGLLRKHGGTILSDIPAPLPHPRRRTSLRFNSQRLPVVLCTKKLQTTRFLYGCAVNAFLLKVGWAYDSIRVGSVLAPDEYLILSSRSNRALNQIRKSICQNDNNYIFDRVGVMLHGTHNFCTKLAKVIKHGRGNVHKSLQWLVESLEKKKTSLGVIVVQDEIRAARHLKKCASEQKIAVVPASWVINSLTEGKLFPLPEENCRLSNPRAISVPETPVLQDCSQEIF